MTDIGMLLVRCADGIGHHPDEDVREVDVEAGLVAHERAVLEHLDDLATYRASELADRAGVSKATMSRLFRSLGFAGFDEVRDHLRSLRSAGEPRRVDEGGTPAEHAQSDASAIAVALGQPSVGRAVELLADADRVLVVGWRNGHVVALHLRQQLAQVRPDVRLAPCPARWSVRSSPISGHATWWC